MKPIEISVEPCEPKPFPKDRAQEGEVVFVEMTKAAARRLTDQIKGRASELAELLHQAHEGRAWKALGYDSWKAYCETEFRMTKQRAYQLLDFVEVKIQLESQQLLTPQTEGQIRPLTKLEPDQRTAAWERAVDIADGGQPTAEQVAEAVSEALAESLPRLAEALSQIPIHPEDDVEPFVEDDVEPALEQEIYFRIPKELEDLWKRMVREYPELTWSIYSEAVRQWLFDADGTP